MPPLFADAGESYPTAARPAGVPWIVAYWVMKVIIAPVLFVFFRVRVEGREHVPGRGGAVLAANHQSFCDSFFLPLVVTRKVTYLAKAEYFDDRRVAWFFRAAGQIPIRREGGDASQRALASRTASASDTPHSGPRANTFSYSTRTFLPPSPG